MNEIVLTVAPYFMAFLTVCPLLLLGLPGRNE